MRTRPPAAGTSPRTSVGRTNHDTCVPINCIFPFTLPDDFGLTAREVDYSGLVRKALSSQPRGGGCVSRNWGQGDTTSLTTTCPRAPRCTAIPRLLTSRARTLCLPPPRRPTHRHTRPPGLHSKQNNMKITSKARFHVDRGECQRG